MTLTEVIQGHSSKVDEKEKLTILNEIMEFIFFLHTD